MKKIKVRAIIMGYYGEKRIRPGSVFEIPEKTKVMKDDKEVEVDTFNPEWMEIVSKTTPIKNVKRPEDLLPEGFNQKMGDDDEDELDSGESVL